MKISRRSVLRYSGLTAALLALTGCSGARQRRAGRRRVRVDRKAGGRQRTGRQ